MHLKTSVPHPQTTTVISPLPVMRFLRPPRNANAHLCAIHTKTLPTQRLDHLRVGKRRHVSIGSTKHPCHAAQQLQLTSSPQIPFRDTRYLISGECQSSNFLHTASYWQKQSDALEKNVQRFENCKAKRHLAASRKFHAARLPPAARGDLLEAKTANLLVPRSNVYSVLPFVNSSTTEALCSGMAPFAPCPHTDIVCCRLYP